jgi:hypothetical protein
VLAAAAALLLWSSVAAAQDAAPAAEPHVHGQPPAATPAAPTDDNIQKLAARMNAATGDEKTAAMAELLNALVAERAALKASSAPAAMPAMKHMAGMCPMMTHKQP